ncbi:MAG: Cache 3/Cache 2 fusion domain-containing protein [Opitutales bacterium]|nr:Cache 3/Cache 2 fusion domain-containing protein [Opitutales bacterium]
MKHSSLNAKLITLTLVSTLLPVVILILFFYRQSVTSTKLAEEGILSAANDDLRHTAENLYAEAEMARSLLEASTSKVSAFANGMILERGGVTTDESDYVEWDAIDQYSLKSSKISLPKMLLGGAWLGQVKSFSEAVPIVDEVTGISGDTCTIFQRMNEAGDMLRIATSIKGADGNRLVGTYIPAVHQDGTKDKVLEQILAGNEYRGRANIMGEWYQTSYRPITDWMGNVVGIVYVGSKERLATDSLRQRVVKMKIGQDGYVFIINTKGKERGRYELSLNNSRDDQNVLGMKDANGRPVIKEMIEAVEKADKGAVINYSYDWKNGSEPLRSKIAILTYYEPWDWMIGVSTYEDDFMANVIEMHEENTRSIISSIVLALVFAIISCLGIGYVIRRVVRKIELITSGLRTGAHETGNAARDVSRSSEDLASGANEQASAIEETTATINELTAQTHANAESANTARDLIIETGSLVDDADVKMRDLNDSMKEIANVSAQTQKIVKTIDEIAFQTNILALNAAVEAARAGEAGAGFAVVANEVRNLAQRSAEAARTTNQLIHDSTDRINSGCVLADNANDAFSRVREKTSKVAELITQIAEASDDQQLGHDQIEKAIGEMNSVVQRNAATAEESAAASEELFAQSEQLLASVNELNVVIMGGNAHTVATESIREESRKRGNTNTQSSSRFTPQENAGNGRFLS